MMLRYTLAWFPMVVLAVLNGALREFTYGRVMPELSAHQVSSVTLIFAFGTYVRFLGARWPLGSCGHALAVGFIWLVLTVLFEFFAGFYISHRTLEEMLSTYNITAGSLWPLVLAAVTLLPSIMFWLGRRG